MKKNKDNHGELQRLSGKIESQDKLRQTFYQVFQRGSRINNVPYKIPILLVLGLALETTIQHLLGSDQKFMLTCHCIGIVLFLSQLKRTSLNIEKVLHKMVLKDESVNEVEQAVKDRVYQHNHHLSVLAYIVCMRLLAVISSVYIEQEIILYTFTLVGLTSRFKYKTSTLRMIYPTVIVFIIMAVLHESNLNLIVYSVIGLVFNIESIQWRQRFLKKEIGQKQDDFDKVASQLKEDAEKKFLQLTEEFENSSNQFTTSRAEEILAKLRLLKYQGLIKKNDAMRLKLKSKYSPPQLEIQKSVPQYTTNDFVLFKENQSEQQDSQDQSDIASENLDKRRFNRKSFRQLTAKSDQEVRRQQPQNYSPENARTLNQSHVNQSQDPNIESDFLDEIKENSDPLLLNDEIDDIIKLIQGRREQIWLPQFLRSNKNITSRQDLSKQDSFSPEAKSFILDHFTEKEFNFSLLKVEQEQTSPSWNIGEGKELALMANSENNYSFDFFEIVDQGQSLSQVFINYSTFMFIKYSIHRVLQINSNQVMIEFFHRLESVYLSNPYHNAIHAIDVANSAAFFLENGLSDLITQFEASCLLISCLAHDVGHPGLNNGFMVASKSKQALLYNDQSVLENYHASLLFHILQDPKANITQNLSDVDARGFRKYCLNLILDTDLQKHFPLLTKFKNFLALGEKNFQDEQNKLLILSISIKAADVGHGAKSLKLHKTWSRRIIEEFFLQGDLEQQVGMPVTPMCDRNLSVTKSQEGFLKAICLPLFEAFSEVLQSQYFDTTCIHSIHDNIQYWQHQQKEEQDGKKKPTFFKDTDNIQQAIWKMPKKDVAINFQGII